MTSKSKIKEKLDAAVEQYRQNMFDEAIDSFHKIINDNPESADANNLLGVTYGRKGKSEEAVKYINKAITLKPGNVAYRYNLGQTYRAGYQLDKAIACYTELLEIDPHHFAARKDLIIILRYQGKLKEALEHALKITELHQENAHSYNVLGEVYVDAGRVKEAEENFKKAISLAPEFYHPYSNLGNIKHNQNKIDEAQELFEKSLSLNPKQPIVKHALAAIKGETPDKPDNMFVISLFNHYADNFDEHMKHLSYNIPKLLFDAVIKHAGGDRKNMVMADLGCGTGACGELFKNQKKFSLGIDLSPKMIEHSLKRRVYDELVIGEIVNVMAARPEEFDLVIAGDVFIYVGDLENIFSVLSGKIKKGGLLAFSIEEDEGEKFSLHNSGRYKHSGKYIENLAGKNKFSIVHDQKTGIRMQLGTPIPGRVMVLRRD